MCIRDRVNIGFNTLCGELFNRLQALGAHWDFDDYVFMDFGKLKSFLNHFRSFKGDDFRRNWTVDNFGNLFDDLNKIPALFCNQGRIGGDAADNAKIVGFSNVVYIRGINEQFQSGDILSSGEFIKLRRSAQVSQKQRLSSREVIWPGRNRRPARACAGSACPEAPAAWGW